MFGNDYHTKDRQLANGTITQLDYARQLLAELLNRTVSFGAIIDDYVSDNSSSAFDEVAISTVAIFRRDLQEISARAGRAGLVLPHCEGMAEAGEPEERHVKDCGGLLVHGQEG